jgi:hypothetical protein
VTQGTSIYDEIRRGHLLDSSKDDFFRHPIRNLDRAHAGDTRRFLFHSLETLQVPALGGYRKCCDPNPQLVA